MRSLFPVILFMILLCGCMQLDTGSFRTAAREPESTEINKIDLASTGGGNVQGEVKDERISLIATRVSDISDRMEKIENRLNDMESSLYQKNEDFQQDMRSMISELNSRINQLSEIQNKTISVANELVKSYQILNQNFLTLQQNFLELQKNQDSFQNQIEKNLTDSKLLAVKEIERISNEKTKVFIEELTKQAEINARQSDIINQIEKKIDAIEKNNVEIEKNLSNTLEKKFGVIFDEITRHESVIRATNKKIEDENIRLSKRFDEGINKSFNDMISVCIATYNGEKHIKEQLNSIIPQLEKNDEIKEIATLYQHHRNFLYLGRGIQFPVALEGALKLKEISYIHAEGYPAAEMKHGPIALIDENMPVVFIAIKDEVYQKVISNMQEVKARKGKIIAIATEGDEEIQKFADHVFYVPATIKIASPLLTVIPLQLLAYHIAVLRGCNVDQPRNLAKSVTVE